MNYKKLKEVGIKKEFTIGTKVKAKAYKAKKNKQTKTTPLQPVETTKVDVYSKDGKKIDPQKMSEKEKRMQQVLDTISKAGTTGKYLICITVHDPDKKLKLDGGDLHHFAFKQDFPNDDSFGCLDEYARLLGLGDK